MSLQGMKSASATSTAPAPALRPAADAFTTTTASSRPRRLRICLSVDFDALSGYLGTGHDPQNTLSDYSAGLFSANVGVGRLLKLFRKHGISDKVTWFIPGHSMESFPSQTRAIVASGAEVGLHGYSHEGAYAMSVQQERDVLEKCIELAKGLYPDQRRPVGYRAPLYQIRESTVNLLQEYGFLYDSSMNHYDAVPYFLTRPFPTEVPHVPDYKQPASTWMHPFVPPTQPPRGSQEANESLVEIPGSWYTEDLTPMGYYPYLASTQGYVAVDVVEGMWWDRFNWIWRNESFLDEDEHGFGTVFPLIWHPECAGRSHVIGMIDSFILNLVNKVEEAGGEITFETMESVASAWRGKNP
jgi:hypothetical protein